ncbi:MAG: VOC family protein [bacterium]|nr:VOC family protein [bacterium]
MRIERLDHLVLTVRDLEASVAFYRDLLGMEEIEFGDGRRALGFGPHKINLHPIVSDINPRAAQPVAGSGDLCLVIQGSIKALISELDAQGVRIELGPVRRTGALGPLVSLYLRDPDENLVELSSYEPEDRELLY